MRRFLKMFLVIAMVLSLTPVSYAAADEQSESNGSVKCSIISAPGDLQNLIDTDVDYSSQDVITTNWSGTSSPHKIVVNEEGWIFITIFEKENHADCNLYSNFALTSKIATVSPFTDKTNTLACYVEPGSYYYQISRWTGYDPSTTTSYVGFMPASSRIKVDKIDYSADKSKATVTFDYDEDYLPNFLDGTIRVKKGTVSYKDIYNDDTWEVENRENALEKNCFTTTSNGTYTARIAGTTDNYFCKVSFEITDLASNAPRTPKITSYKSGSSTVSGTGLAGAKVYVTINGNTYSDTVNSNGDWSVTTSSSIRRGTRIKAYIKNAAGSKSKTTTVIVK